MRFLSGYRDAAVIVLNCLILLALVEVAVRTLDHKGFDSQKFLVTIGFDYAPYRMSKQVRADFPLNSDGFRAPELSELAKEKDAFTVLFIGASTCVGFGKNTGEPVSALLEQELHQRGMAKARVINLCQGGAVSMQELLILLQYGLPLHPDAVVQFTGANDIFHPAPLGEDAAIGLPYEDAMMRALWHRPAPWVVNLRLVDHLRLWLDSPPAPERPAVISSAAIAENFMQNVVNIHHLLAPDTLHVVLLQPSSVFRRPQPSAEEVVRIKELHSGEDVAPLVAERYGAVAGALDTLAHQLPNFMWVDGTGIAEKAAQTVYLDSVHFDGPWGNQQLAALLAKSPAMKALRQGYKEWESTKK
ncbi:MAG: hypothetical protein GC129_02185 [Proteobacteria bacterium]|nr:hypothetical protein [Pseudomonadota bacterium]